MKYWNSGRNLISLLLNEGIALGIFQEPIQTDMLSTKTTGEFSSSLILTSQNWESQNFLSFEILGIIALGNDLKQRVNSHAIKERHKANI